MSKSGCKLIKLELNRDGVRELLRSNEIREAVSESAEKIRGRCGDGYETDTFTGRNRVNASVYADTPKAKRDNPKNNTLLKAMR